MKQQNQIKRTLATPESIEVIRRLLADGKHRSRMSFARGTCGHFGFVDAREQAQTVGCTKALGELGRSGHIELPISSCSVKPRGRR